MFGAFQQSDLRIEVEASAAAIRNSLLQPEQLRQWLSPQSLSRELPPALQPGSTFFTWIGPVRVRHQVIQLESNSLQLLLSEGIDGFHHWSWGEGWIQSSLQGVSLMPLNLGQTLTLLRLRRFLTAGRR